VIKVPDARLDKLTELFSPKRTIYATIEVVDVVGLKKGESGSTQFTTNFLSNVKTNDALVQVVRLFANDTVPHPDGSIDAERDIASFETEFILSDLGIVETRIERIRKQMQKTGEDQTKKELPVLEKALQALNSEKPLRAVEFTKEEALVMKTYQLLSSKPMLIALNMDESQRQSMPDTVRRVAAKYEGKNTRVVAFFGKIEMELSELPEEEARVFMDEPARPAVVLHRG
jgi:ribosome-binding ATPase YchF (GTP1/OBG family)